LRARRHNASFSRKNAQDKPGRGNTQKYLTQSIKSRSFEFQGAIMIIEKPDRTLWFVAFICFIDMCGLGLIIPVMPSLVGGLADVSLDRAAEIGGLLLFAYAAMQFLFAPVIGGLSDRFGRRPVLLATLFVLGIDYLIMALAPNLIWLFIGRTISGIMGATWAAANSCVADKIAPEERGRAFGLLGAGGAAGFVTGPALGGLLGLWGDRAPFYAAAVLALIGVLVGWRYLQETLPEERRRPFDWARANPLGSILQMRGIPLVTGILTVIFLMQLAAQSQIAVWSYYTILKFGWTSVTVGLSMALFGILIGIAQGVLAGQIIARFGEARAAVGCLITVIPAYLVFTFATAGWMMFAGMLVSVFANATFPALQAMMTRATPENAQGELQGAIASIVGITSIIGPVMMTAVFGHFADQQGLFFPGAPFLLAASIMAVAIVYLSRVVKHA
jgi:DHA1 family tetracycline resistance protein-like MFS transporter